MLPRSVIGHDQVLRRCLRSTGLAETSRIGRVQESHAGDAVYCNLCDSLGNLREAPTSGPLGTSLSHGRPLGCLFLSLDVQNVVFVRSGKTDPPTTTKVLCHAMVPLTQSLFSFLRLVLGGRVGSSSDAFKVARRWHAVGCLPLTVINLSKAACVWTTSGNRAYPTRERTFDRN